MAHPSVDLAGAADTDLCCRWHVSDGRWRYVPDELVSTDGAGVVSTDCVAADATKTPEAGQESPFRVPVDTLGTPQGPHLTPGEPLCFLSSASPDAASPDAQFDFLWKDANSNADSSERDLALRARCAEALDIALDTEQSGAVSLEGYDDEMIPTLEAVDPMYPREFGDGSSMQDAETASGKSEGSASVWKKISPVNAAKQVSAQAQKARGQVSEKMQRGFGYMKGQAEGTLRVPGQVSLACGIGKGLGYVKGHTESALKAPAQMSEYAKVKAGNARETAQTVSAAVTTRVSQTAQKGFEIAKGVRIPHARGRTGGA